VFVAQSRETPPVPLTSGVPQGSSLGPARFILYTECSVDVFSAHGVHYHLFADDTQSYDTCPVSTTCIQSTLTRLSSYINDLAALFSSLRLQLNSTKSEFMWFGSRVSLAKIRPTCGFYQSVGQLSAVPTSCVISESGSTAN